MRRFGGLWMLLLCCAGGCTAAQELAEDRARRYEAPSGQVYEAAQAALEAAGYGLAYEAAPNGRDGSLVSTYRSEAGGVRTCWRVHVQPTGGGTWVELALDTEAGDDLNAAPAPQVLGRQAARHRYARLLEAIAARL